MRWSVRLRATVAATFIVAVALAAAAVTLTTVLRANLENSAAEQAVRRADAVAGLLSVAGTPAQPVWPSAQAATSAPTVATGPEPGIRTQPGTGTAPGTRTEPGAGPKAGVGTGTGLGPGAVADPDVRIGSVAQPPSADWTTDAYTMAATTVRTQAGPMTVLARSSLQPAREALTVLNRLLVFGIPVLLLLVAAMTWFLVGRALVPVSGIRARLADITARDLHRRVPVPAARDEVAALARTVNATLDRLEKAVGQHKRFVADAAHELRSPIATLRTRLELAPPGETAREALADLDRLQALAADLLLLAALDAGEPPRTGEVDLGQVAAEESLRPRAGARVRLAADPDVVVAGSRSHLARLVTNLVDNAVRHAASAVEVRVRAEGRDAVLEVRDDGPGIPPEHREAVFDRFTRLDGARARDAGGSGLGLAIVRDIAVLHGGRVTVTGREGGGAAFTVRLPLAPAPGDRSRDAGGVHDPVGLPRMAAVVGEGLLPVTRVLRDPGPGEPDADRPALVGVVGVEGADPVDEAADDRDRVEAAPAVDPVDGPLVPLGVVRPDRRAVEVLGGQRERVEAARAVEEAVGDAAAGELVPLVASDTPLEQSPVGDVPGPDEEVEVVHRPTGPSGRASAR
ncbi:sensor histidine kinase [Microbispora corallina]|uniref:sensor histidine kinase n=1 Tax=Microbispora corallina TaxID=83302 RepID=UPI001EF36A90|nr:HAMP domain-containing sensor histidine kinase [Microbispora corallina]